MTDEATARHLLLQLIEGNELPRQRRRLRGILLSRHLLWATFDREDERQAAEGAEHGWTVPRPGGYACPEVVHRTVDGAQMVLPLRRYAH